MKSTNLEHSKKYRTIHSINDQDVALIDEYVQTYSVKTFLDYGCHFGHLSVYLAKTYPITVFAVDNFTGTIGDELMANTVLNLTKDGNFYQNVVDNINESMPLKGEIILKYSDSFLAEDTTIFDFAFIDSSHRIEEVEEFKIILNKVKIGGLIGGHDYLPNTEIPGYLGPELGIKSIENYCEWLVKEYTWLMKRVV